MSAITVIVELKARPGERDALRQTFEAMLARETPGLDGFLGSVRYERLDDPDVLVEVAEWSSAEARKAHLEHAAKAGTYAALFAELAAPAKVTVLRRL